MKMLLNHKRTIIFIGSALAALAIYMRFIPLNISADNMIYAIGEIHTYDPALFNGNIYPGSGVNSPRLFWDVVISWLMHINGGNWVPIAVGMEYLNALVLSFATAKIGCRICNKYQFVYTCLFALMLTLNKNCLASFGLFACGSISTGCAFAVALLAISYVIGQNKKFNIAWLLLSVTAAMHIHEGLYGFAIIFIMFCVELLLKERKFRIKENWGLLLYVFTVLLITIPRLATDVLPISNAEFVEIYGKFFGQMHLRPSYWGMNAIIASAFTIIGFVILRLQFLYLHERTNVRRFLWEAGLCLVAWSMCLGCAYVFTEVYPVAAIVTMFVSKFFKYVVIFTLLWMLWTIKGYYENREYLHAFLLLCYVFAVNTDDIRHKILWFVCCFFILQYDKTSDKTNDSALYPGILGAIFTAIMVFDVFGEIQRDLKIVLCLLVLVVAAGKLAKRFAMPTVYRAIAVCSAAMYLLCAYYGKIYYLENGNIRAVNTDQIMSITAGNDICELADTFKSRTNSAASFITDPNDERGGGWFQIFAERNCYVLRKVIPSSKVAAIEWYKRYENVVGIYDKSPDEIADIMKREGISYFLVNSSYYGNIDQSSCFDIFLTCGGDSYRIYQLV